MRDAQGAADQPVAVWLGAALRPFGQMERPPRDQQQQKQQQQQQQTQTRDQQQVHRHELAATCGQAAHSKRKEKARIAARARRSQEAAIITEIAAELAIGQERLRRIDKATIIRLALDYMKAWEALCAPAARQLGPAEPEPKLSTSSIFAPRTADLDTRFLVLKSSANGDPALELRPDAELRPEDDLTHLAPQAGETCISLDVEPLEGIVLDLSHEPLFLAATCEPLHPFDRRPTLVRPAGSCRQHNTTNL